MPIIRITKVQLEEAAEAHKAALEKDPDFAAFEEELKRQEEELKQLNKERKS